MAAMPSTQVRGVVDRCPSPLSEQGCRRTPGSEPAVLVAATAINCLTTHGASAAIKGLPSGTTAMSARGAAVRDGVRPRVAENQRRPHYGQAIGPTRHSPRRPVGP